MARRTKWVLVIIGGLIILTILAFIGYSIYSNLMKKDIQKDDTLSYSNLTNDVKQQEVTSNEAFAQLIEKYSDRYQETRAEVILIEPKEWNAATVEKVYFIIAYSMKVEEYRMIGVWLDKLDEAAAAGVNIDVPAIGANKEYRDKTRATFNDAMTNSDYRPSSAKRNP